MASPKITQKSSSPQSSRKMEDNEIKQPDPPSVVKITLVPASQATNANLPSTQCASSERNKSCPGRDSSQSPSTVMSESSLGDSRSPDVDWRDSCVSDMSETSSSDSTRCSTSSPKDESNGSGLYGPSSSDQEKQKQITHATFDKVLTDADQRWQIRNKTRNRKTDSGSDSSSGNLDMNEVGSTSMPGMKLHSFTSDSSGIEGNDIGLSVASVKRDLELPHSTILQSGGVTNSSTGVSTMYSSQGNKTSHNVKQDSSSSLSSGSRKRHIPWSIAKHYYQTKRASLSTDLTNNETEDFGVDVGTMASNQDSLKEKKRKRFQRTFTALRQCGLLDLTMQTASLMEQNAKLQRKLAELHRQAHLMYHTVTHFSKIQPNAFASTEAKQVMNGLKEMVEKNPVTTIDAPLPNMFESRTAFESGDSGNFTNSNAHTSAMMSNGVDSSGASGSAGHSQWSPCQTPSFFEKQ